jgi:hypothetical protein
MKRILSIVAAVTFSFLLAELSVFDGGPGGWLSVQEAHAVVGRPATPVSAAGVARRTTRRTVTRHSTYPGAIATLPAGCAATSVGGATHYACGGVVYKPYYDGPDLVYVPAQ